ncbi:MAG: SAM-dependent chlorinase/fluorinase [Desulfobulbus sp.]|nr:SAM-dependent chlorinase/fluorinase [Desulfobulbus sp.]
MEQAPPIITLITDFGLADSYVGQLKGVLLKGCPFATLVDITHAVPVWNVLAAALTLQTSYTYFPVGTVHLIVVDPGVGSCRSILAAQGKGHFFVCPDNGILSFLIETKVIQRVHRVEHISAAEMISPTFHGRDIMAPVAATLAQRTSLDAFGPSLALSQLQQISLPEPIIDGGLLQGQVLTIDHFGNVRTSIRAGTGFFDTRRFASLEILGQSISQLVTSYSEVPIGTLTVLIDSAGFLEIAANQANAAALIGCVPGESLTVKYVQK